MRKIWILVAHGSLFGCVGPDHMVSDAGRVCVEPEVVEAFEEAGPLLVTVLLDECISACANDPEATCTAELQGDTIVVHSEGQWSDPQEGCIAVCASLQAECTLEDVPPGDYTVQHGNETWALALPSDLDQECLQ